MSTDRFEFKLPALPWPANSLEPFLSAKAISVHYDGHHKAYVDKMNTLAREYPELQSLTLEEIVNRYTLTIRDTAAQILNHNFFWKCLSPTKSMPTGNTYTLISNQFQSFENFVREFTNRAINHFGSGWIWLVYDPSTKFLLIVDGHDAYNPIMDGYIPLLTIDVWEHAYYVDYLNDKRTYVENFWSVVNWSYVEAIARERIFGNFP